jgi:hypothetical protein
MWRRARAAAWRLGSCNATAREPQEAAMIVTDVIIRTQPGRAAAVEAHLERRVPGFQSRHMEGGDCIVASWCAPSASQPEALGEILQAIDPDIISVDPTVLGVIGE